MWIVKLGGSLATGSALLPWLRMLAEFGPGRVTVVPGGGPFADTVRQQQKLHGSDDLAAHNMAVLAMGQMALMMHALEPRLMLVSAESQVPPALRAGKVPLWLPLTALRDAPDQTTSWDVTSDSLALKLACTLHAERLVVVKSCAIDPHHSLAEHSRLGVLDARFARWAEQASFPIDLVSADQTLQVQQALVLGHAA
jgi:aspartokinase-like uncharacterized kinase